jgi:hypothetical protein
VCVFVRLFDVVAGCVGPFCRVMNQDFSESRDAAKISIIMIIFMIFYYCY